MKKTLFISLAAFFALAVCANAQSDSDLFADPCKDVKNATDKVIELVNAQEPDIEQAIAAATAIAFTDKCGLDAHGRIVNALVNKKISDETYGAFLIKESYNVDDPVNDARSTIVLKYFASDGVISDEEFEAGIHFLTKLPATISEYYLKSLYVDNENDFMKFEERIRRLLGLAAQNQLGRLTESDVFNQSLSIKVSARNHVEALWLINTLSNELNLVPGAKRNMFTHMQNALFSGYPESIKTLYLDAILNFMHSTDYDYRIGMQMFNIQRDAYQEIIDGSPEADFYTKVVKRIHRQIAPWLCYTYQNIPIPRSKAFVNQYLTDNNIACQ